MIKAILFDIDGVLLDSREANRKFEEDIVVNAGYKKPTKQEASKVYNLTLYETIRYLTKEQSGEKIKAIWQSAIDSYKIKYPKELLKLPFRMTNIIKQLSQQYKLGIVTGRLKRGVEIFYKASGLQKYFEVISCLDDYSKPKPDPEPLMVALAKLNLKSEETIYVGDSITDLQAAQSIKMKFIGFYGISGNIFEEADANVKTFRELSDVIDKLSKLT